MTEIHRIVCDHPDCADRGRGRVWREGCAECAEDTAARHRRETGHPVEVTITDGRPMWEVRRMTRRLPGRRGW